jgi:hypothetical protein
MHTTDVLLEPRRPLAVRIIRGWWPAAAIVAAALVAGELLLTSRYDVGGHAAEHLASASAPFMAGAMVAIIFWATPLARRQWDVIAAAAVWLGTTVLVMFGNLRVVDDLIATGNSHTPTASIPDVADHTLANAAPWYAVVAALVLIGTLRVRRHLGNRATIAAVVLTLIVPPWFIPGAGVVVAAIVRAVHKDR